MSGLPAPFSAALIRDAGVLRLVLRGELDLATLHELERALPEPAPGDTLLIDLRDLLFIDSSGIHVLMRLDVAARAEAWMLALVRGPRDVQRVLDVCYVSDRVRMVDSPAEISPALG